MNLKENSLERSQTKSPGSHTAGLPWAALGQSHGLVFSSEHEFDFEHHTENGNPDRIDGCPISIVELRTRNCATQGGTVNCDQTLRWLRAALGAIALLIFPALLAGQSSARDALSMFPADTQELAYSNLAMLRSQPNYETIEAGILSSQLRGFTSFLQTLGIDSDKDVDEVTLGWHGSPIDPSAYYGLAWGRFDPGKVHDYFVQEKLPWQQYGGYDLYAFGSGGPSRDLYFSFLSYSAAAFGRLGDLKTLIDVRAGSKSALGTKPDFAKYEDELEGTSSQWGIATGAAAVSHAAPWLGGGGQLPIDPKSLMAPIKAVLYHVDWGSDFSMHMSVVCDSVQSASMLAQLVTAWQTARQVPQANTDPALTSFIQGLQVQADGSRVELTGTAPVEIVGQILSGPPPPPSHQ
jgi:hypothetical protein